MLSETKGKEGTTIKQKLLDYLYEHRGNGQVIIVEQEDKMPSPIDTWKSKATEDSLLNIINFTGTLEYGVYGFLPNVTNEE